MAAGADTARPGAAGFSTAAAHAPPATANVAAHTINTLKIFKQKLFSALRHGDENQAAFYRPQEAPATRLTVSKIEQKQLFYEKNHKSLG